jgi:MoxR-like ATPase
VIHKLLAPAPQEATTLEPQGSWPKAYHLWKQEELHALAVAYHSGRPLLVKGEPGVGKSQIARAAASLLGWRFVYEVITPRFEPQELLWRYDAVRRLADANVHTRDADNEGHYVTAGVLWHALDPENAPGARAKQDANELAKPGCVLLLDEIDKADSDLPNSLLEVLGNRGFSTPWDDDPQGPTGPKNPAKPLLTIITSNDERELPNAFMRRCVVFEIKAPNETTEPGRFITWLIERGAAQFKAAGKDPGIQHSVLEAAAKLVQRDRVDATAGMGARPGLAEYLDLLRALHSIAPGDAGKQKDWLLQLSPYVLRKQGQDQTPQALPGADDAADDAAQDHSDE